MRTLIRGFLVPAAALTLVLGACGDDDETVDDDGGDAAGAVTTTPTDGDGGGGGDADVTMIDFAFDPSEISVAAGATITVANQDGATHTFTSEDAGIDVELGGGESGEATAPDEPGDYSFLCRIHPSMTGTLTVA